MKSVYIHIPFCKTICSYCDFCKLFYNKSWVKKYLSTLEKEIKNNYQNEIINTLYIGGGTPTSLDIDELKELFRIIKVLKFTDELEFTVECNIENLTEEKLMFFYQNGVNRLSIGVQTVNEKHLLFLERNHTKEKVKEIISKAKNIGFKNINIDLMYAFPNETINELKEDLSFFTSLNPTHISTYSLMIEPHTKIYNKVDPISEELDEKMYNTIIKFLEKKGYHHYETSNFCKEGFSSKHNLVYWNNEEYYGFGLGASGYIGNIRYENTKNLNHYFNENYRFESHFLPKREIIENEFILGFRKIEGIHKNKFKDKFHIDIHSLKPVEKLLKKGYLKEDEDRIFINSKYQYVANEILIYFINMEV